MNFFSNIRTQAELKKKYRNMALMHHPDHGGDVIKFIQIQREYALLNRKFELLARGISGVKENDTVYVNGTECFVERVLQDTFIAQSKESGRRAIFYRSNGFGKFHPQFKATVINTRHFKAHAKRKESTYGV